jgi:N-dimethylarginine dimethylaminohydrolase
MIAVANVISRPEQLPADFIRGLRSMPYPESVLMCPPDHFDVVDVKNPFMANQTGRVDRGMAQKQWEALKRRFEEIGLRVEIILPRPDCEDMAFAANQAFVGLDEQQRKICVASRMKFCSRQREVPAFAEWFRRTGYTVRKLNGNHLFEGGGDAIWHPGRALIWGGYGQRSDCEVYPQLANLFNAPVILLHLVSERFYHLDTCFCPIDDGTALVHMPALAGPAQDFIRAAFRNVIEVDEHEATDLLACNAAAFCGRDVVLQAGAVRTMERLQALGFRVHPVETGEFMKSGGSVFCMKTAFF